MAGLGAGRKAESRRWRWSEWIRGLWRLTEQRVWLRQPAASRIRVAKAHRFETRREMERSLALLAAARGSTPGPARDQLSTAALSGLLAAIGRSSPSGDEPASAVRAGIARIEPALPAEALRAALSAFALGRSGPATERQFRELVELCTWIEALVDNRSERERRLHRALPAAAAAVATLIAAHALLADENLALGKAIAASSICSLTPAARHGKPALSRVVDGVIFEGPAIGAQFGETAFAVCTKPEKRPWLRVDLEAEHQISEIVVYNRSDCCWSLNDASLKLQLSVDNEKFVTVGKTRTPFTAQFPWRVSVGGQRARYVRLYKSASTANDIVISELEVYGR